MGSLLLRDGRALHLGGPPHEGAIDIGIDSAGRVAMAGTWDGRQPFDRVLDLRGAWISPAWIDLHVHCYYGGTWLSVRPEQIGPATGVGLLVDCGSAGEANFRGLREFIMSSSPFPILAYLHISSIGLVAANRFNELPGWEVIDAPRTLACVEENRDVIRGIKIRASHQIIREWGITPVRVAKQVAAAAGLPLVVHIGEAPPTLGEILDVLGPGDVVTHCFTGRITTSIGRHEPFFRRLAAMAREGLILDVGHGQGSFNFAAARRAIDGGLLPTVISTDLHIGNLWGPVWDLATTMSKMLTVGMTMEDVVERATAAPARFLALKEWGSIRIGAPARFTIFDLSDGEESLPDSDGNFEVVHRFFEPRHTVLDSRVTDAARNTARDRRSTAI